MFSTKKLYLLFVVFSVVISCSATKAVADCESWYNDTAKKVTALQKPEEQLQFLLKKLSDECSLISKPLQQAAFDAMNAPVDSEFGQVLPLLNAAMPYVGNACQPISPDIAASSLAPECLGKDHSSSFLESIGASNYLYAKAIETEWKKIGKDKEYKRLLRFFTLYSAKVRENRLAN
jgi:hypothetical protein